ncbi:MAG: tetratricopeptide repeat protein [Treponema sp.]|jgi:tetratricopeptide (TPR) repeat protein|nr:tetratricopeptide repeat protein [Treponema sp.]
MAGKTENLSIGEKLNDFIQRNRKPLIIGIAVLLGLIIALVAFLSIREYVRSRALTKVDELSRRYDAIMYSLSYADDETDQTSLQLALYGLLNDLEDFQKRNSGYAAARAYAISASIYTEQGSWYSAENAWLDAAYAGRKTYFAPVAYFNAAVAAEEQNNISRAIELYEKALEFEDLFPAAPRAQFSIGRLYEIQGSYFDALFAYQTLVNKWPQDQVWVSLAHSRILYLTLLQ